MLAFSMLPFFETFDEEERYIQDSLNGKEIGFYLKLKPFRNFSFIGITSLNGVFLEMMKKHKKDFSVENIRFLVIKVKENMFLRFLFYVAGKRSTYYYVDDSLHCFSTSDISKCVSKILEVFSKITSDQCCTSCFSKIDQIEPCLLIGKNKKKECLICGFSSINKGFSIFWEIQKPKTESLLSYKILPSKNDVFGLSVFINNLYGISDKSITQFS